MSDTAPIDEQIVQTPPPAGDPQKAQRYLDTLMDLLGVDKLMVNHSDLRKYDPTSLQDHYRVRLEDYEVEISHSKQPETGKNSYVMVFSNAKLVQDGQSKRIILAFMYLTEEQFQTFKQVADDQLERERIRVEEVRFKEAMLPIDKALEKLLSQQFTDIPESQTEALQDEVTNDLPAETNLGEPKADEELKEIKPDSTDLNPYSTSPSL
ncbi:hypothetical protein A2631_04505 [Candidatus Daviesbacteria bacterium RIFCSPHIGHO2_01_FULL_44_29]|uniref:Uncharacterized protein n=1 Tax=Candidatus Daviesbacteria bacterium RIFCSPHIGHO2_02_FULL_43_12 TaxID=1797776 RepID=A0A1F5KGM2_9BACT|nr:MAG: hypothetical protein A2631_04505 [Candidatus Daviesbacteria bacterium RIFCSPHIGHO2_01_FULL_44_29]OGE39603.1 MAG: hypothetical protein A3E86_05660 [Candidatus Daviesbacteria bacterium RIFCSPHIGHO2_12_FULL_47_45]OGE39984.1 MAG: hypothetical protein A3D25_04235 [Candidatus Daviesbacteria bacterium RIFCSPHIGHO2_02_FULL_43_12]OGE70335.1 MAG: hypothetical protein A3B55_01335 [Candidatus Daviesbacteria bacterium RIFCSPLOWO2_01_FULL_43_15]